VFSCVSVRCYPGCKCPIDIHAVSSVSVSIISVRKFERLFGDVSELCASAGYLDAQNLSLHTQSMTHTQVLQAKFRDTDATSSDGSVLGQRRNSLNQQTQAQQQAHTQAVYAPVSLTSDNFETVELLNYVHMGWGAIGHCFGASAVDKLAQSSAASMNDLSTDACRGANLSTNTLVTSVSTVSALPTPLQPHNTQMPRKKYFLKILSKQAIVIEGQRKHVLAEASTLSTVAHTFMVHLYSRSAFVFTLCCWFLTSLITGFRPQMNLFMSSSFFPAVTYSTFCTDMFPE
jgi:hypothetical protein